MAFEFGGWPTGVANPPEEDEAIDFVTDGAGGFPATSGILPVGV